MKALGIGSIIAGVLMLLAGMSGELTCQISHDTILMVMGGVFGVLGVGLLAYDLAHKAKDN